jgi:hypothetical protein
MLEDYPMISNMVFYILGIVLFIAIPQAWKEDNSWWFAIIKFYLVIFPFMLGAFGVIGFGGGPIFAIAGIFDSNYMGFTLFYAYFIIMGLIVMYLTDRYKNFFTYL